MVPWRLKATSCITKFKVYHSCSLDVSHMISRFTEIIERHVCGNVAKSPVTPSIVRYSLNSYHTAGIKVRTEMPYASPYTTPSDVENTVHPTARIARRLVLP